MRKFVLIIISIILLVAIKLLFFSKTEEQAAGPSQGAKAPPLNVTAVVLIPEELEKKIYVTGTILPNEEVALVPETSGKIMKLNFNEVSLVQKGALLVKINDKEQQAQLKKLLAQQQLAKDKEFRQKQLMNIDGISKEEYETSLNTLESIGADIEFTEAQISKTEIRAPFTGMIGLRNVSEGSYVSPTSRIALLQQIDPVKIDFSVPEKYSGFVKKGNLIRFSLDEKQETFEAIITAIEPRVDINTRTVNVRATCANKQHKILPGSFATIEIILNATGKNLMIPSESLIPVLKGYKVFISRNGIAEEKRVQPGLRTKNRIEIIEGLAEGDTVITSGIMQIKAGSPVNIIRNSMKE